MFRMSELLEAVLELARSLWAALDAHGFYLAGGVAITALEQIPERVRRDYMLAPIYATSVGLTPAR